jgi:cation diffusion facilitator family transporter
VQSDQKPSIANQQSIKTHQSRNPQFFESRYSEVARVLARVLVLNLAVAGAKIAYGYATGAASILSDGFHSLTDAAANVLSLAGVRAARKPPDADHPYGHRKFETLAATGIYVFLLFVVIEVVRSSIGRLQHGTPIQVTRVSFAVMLITLAVNWVVVRYESQAAQRLNSEVLFADAMHTRSDLLTSLTVVAALIAVRAGYPMFDALAALVVAGFIAKAGFDIARHTSQILSDRIVIAEDDIRSVVQSVAGIVGCHRIRTRGSADHVFLDLHVWLAPETRLDEAHRLSHVVKDRLMAKYPQIADAVIHIEPPPHGTYIL